MEGEPTTGTPGQGPPPSEGTSPAAPLSDADDFAARKAAAFAAVEAEARGETAADDGAGTPPPEDGSPQTPTDGTAPSAEDAGTGQPTTEADDDRPLTRRSWAAQKRELEARVNDLAQKLSTTTGEKTAAESAVAEASRRFDEFLGRDTVAGGKTRLQHIYEQMAAGVYGADAEYVRLVENNRLVDPLKEGLTREAYADATARWVARYDTASKLPGVDRAALYAAQEPDQALALVHEAGRASRDAEVTALKGRVASLEADLKEARVGRAARASSPLSGGRAAASNGLAATFGPSGRIDGDWIERAKRGEFSHLDLSD
jgi:hypothetical protein